jgi:hypothetical protein
MFDWLRRKASSLPLKTSPANPGRGSKISLAFTNGKRTWTEDVDLVLSMAEVLRSGSFAITTGKASVQLDSGLMLQPAIVSFKPLQPGGVQTVTTVEVSHAAGIPAGVFEFQHSTGDDTRQSVAKGFEAWMELDLPVFMDALRPKPEKCTFLELELPADGGTPARKRRVVLGPVSHLVSRAAEGQPEEHPFCPCCLFTNCGTVMKPKIHDGRFYGVRLFAMRGQDGAPGADCRLNGEDWEPGKNALVEYVKSWPHRGLEFRKQFVIIQTQPGVEPGPGPT